MRELSEGNPHDPPLTNTQKVRRWRRRNELFEKSVNGKRERKRFEESAKDASGSADAVKRYLEAALPDVVQALVIRALGPTVSSVAACRLILQLVGTDKSRSVFQGAINRMADAEVRIEEDALDADEIKRIAGEIV